MMAEVLEELRRIASGDNVSGDLLDTISQINATLYGLKEEGEGVKLYHINIFFQLVKEQDITEKLKAEDQLKWVGMMNNIRAVAEEIILKELIYD